ncbi:hypothetical protein ACFXKD_27880 [Nocardiopsis aegyptia]|uniref:hypothetical protein n=1 Tax=Nocardiopsis aegyptia TaxID=220378 RepID=UPI00366D3209
MAQTVHVVPLGDLIEHEDEDCPCGPTPEPVEADDGSIGWVITHHSLDGRELHEQEQKMHEAPKPLPGTPAADRRDAIMRMVRTLGQALAVTVLIGASTAVYQLSQSGDVLTLATVGTAAGSGALMAAAAWAQRRLEAYRAERRGE